MWEKPKRIFNSIGAAINFVKKNREKSVKETKEAALKYVPTMDDAINVSSEKDKKRYLMYCAQLLTEEGEAQKASFLKYRAAGYSDNEIKRMFKMSQEALEAIEKAVVDKTKAILERVRTGRIPILKGR